jgi:hypothetical protein
MDRLMTLLLGCQGNNEVLGSRQERIPGARDFHCREECAAATIVALGLAMGGCGGYGSSTQPNRGTASIMVTAHSGAISHTTTVSVTVQ